MPREAHSADAVVIGAGVAGLAAAHHLERRGIGTLVLEADPAPGGRARTVDWAGCRIELGAVYLTGHYASLKELVRAAQLEKELVPLENAFRTAVWRSGEWHHLDYALPADVVRFSALKPQDKASLLALGPALARAVPRLRFFDLATAAALDKQTLADVISRDAARFYASPLFELFCGYRPEEVTLPLMAMSVRFRNGRRFRGRALTLRSGIGTLPARLATDATVQCSVEATSVEAEGGSVLVHARQTDGQGLTYRARVAVLATPADVAARLNVSAPAATRRFLEGVRYSSAFGIYLRTSESFHPTGRRGRKLYMELVPAGERAGALHAVCFLDHLAPDGGLLRVEATPAASASASDEVLADGLQAELEELHPELSGLVTDRLIARSPRIVPAFPVGAVRSLAAFRASLVPGPVQLAGDYLYGPCMESAAQSGKAAAALACAWLDGNRAG